MQFNLVNDQLHNLSGMTLGFTSILGRLPAAFVAWACISPWGAFPGRLGAVQAVSGSFAY